MLLDNWQIQAGDNWLQVPELCEDLLSSVDQPLKIARDKTVSIKSHKYWFHLISSKVGKDYLLCDYNRDGDSYRCVMYYCFCCAWHIFQRLLDKMLTSTTYLLFFSWHWIFCRSPWSNQYEPALDDGAMPSERLRKLEIDANTAFDQYREMYFEGGVSSVYLWDLDHGFAGRLNSERQLTV